MCVGRSGEDFAVKIMLRDYKIRSIAKCPYCGSHMGMTYNKEFMNQLMRFKCNHCGFEQDDWYLDAERAYDNLKKM